MSARLDNEEVTSDLGWSCVGRGKVEVRTGGMDGKGGRGTWGCSEFFQGAPSGRNLEVAPGGQR